MIDKYRKYILYGALGTMLLFYAGDWLLQNALEGPLQARRDKVAQLEADIEKREGQLLQAREIRKQLDALAARSLPANVEVARSLYQGWLLELVNYVELAGPNVDSGEPVGRRGMFQVISFSVRGRGTLEQLTRFLYVFYNAGHLHQIRSLAITPLKESDQLDLAVSIEALVLPGADRTARLTGLRSDRLAYRDLKDYDVIVRRNLFGAGGASDATDYTYLTAVNYVNGKPEAWFDVRTETKLLKLREGQTLEIGPFQGRIAEIADTDVILECGDERWLLTIGENLAQASALPPEF
ncbi:MAG: hypothetical protein HUU20_29260 [Pirellulales bacterium]|nr:hypothetical protein [Pirellulales bacterium]